MSAKRHWYVIIVGCGRVGSLLANRLSAEGHSVVVLDRHGASFDGLSAEFSGFRLEGDALEPAVLKQAKMDQADLVIAATSEDNTNLMIAQMARQVFAVQRVMARVFDPRREAIYRQQGIETVCPTSVAADVFLQALAGAKETP